MSDEHANELELKEKEYLKHFHQLDLHSQGFLRQINDQLRHLREEQVHLQNKHREDVDDVIEEGEKNMNISRTAKHEHYDKMIQRDESIRSQIELFHKNQTHQLQFIDHSNRSNLQAIQCTFRQHIHKIRNQFSQVRIEMNMFMTMRICLFLESRLYSMLEPVHRERESWKEKDRMSSERVRMSG